MSNCEALMVGKASSLFFLPFSVAICNFYLCYTAEAIVVQLYMLSILINAVPVKLSAGFGTAV